MPNIIGFERWQPNHPWGDVKFDDGTVRPVEDPSGEIEREVNSIAQRLAPPPMPDQRLAQVGPGGMVSPAPFTPEQGAQLAGAVQQVADAVAPGMPGTPRAAEVDARRAAAAPAPGAPPAAPGEPPPMLARPEEEPNRAEQVIDKMGLGGLIAVRTGPTQGRFQPSSRSTQGPVDADRESVLTTSDEALKLRGSQIGEYGRAEQLSATRDAITGAVMRDEGKADAERLTGQNAELARRRTEVQRKLSGTAALKEDPKRAWSRMSGWQIAFTAIAAAAGGVKTAVLGGENATLRAVREMIDDDIAAQRNDKTSMLHEYERQLGDLDAAELALKADMKEALAKEAEGQTRVAKSSDRLNHLKGIMDGLGADALDARATLEQRMMGVQQSTDRYVPGTPGGIQVINPTVEQLKRLNITEADWDKFTNAKAGDLPGAASIVNGVRALDERIATVQAIADAHGGTIPSTGVIDFNRSDALRQLGARLGFKGQVSATEVKQLAGQQFLEAQALIKGIPSDRDTKIIEDVVGAGTTDSFKRGVEYFRGQANSQLRARAQVFPGREQAAIEMLQGRMRATPGAGPSGREPF